MSGSVRDVLQKTIDDTDPPSGPFLEVLMRARPKTIVAMGLMQQSRRSLRALIALTDSGLLDTGLGILRTVLENMVTVVWLMDGPNSHFEEFLGDYRRRLVAAAREDPMFQPLLEHFESLMDTWVGNHESRYLRNIDQRASEATAKKMYSIYRHLSGPVHGSIVGSTLQFAVETDDPLSWGDPGSGIDADAHLAFAAALLCLTAMKSFEEFGEEVTGSLRELHQEIMEAWFPDDQ